MHAARPRAARFALKLPLLIVATAVCVALAAGAAASWSFYAASKRMIETNLSVLAHNKRDAVATLIDTVHNDLAAAAANPAVQRSLDKLAIGFEILTADERRNLPTKYRGDAEPLAGGNGSSDFYGREHAGINGWFKAFAREHDYADILFVNRGGSVVYSLARTDVFGASLRDPALAGTSLAKLFRRMADLPSGTTVTTDFVGDGPAGYPVLLSATPVYQMLGNSKDFVGVLVFEMPSARFDQIMNEPDGFGSSGEAFIVGPDGTLRSNSRFGTLDDILKTRFDDPRLIAPGSSTRVEHTTAYGGRDMIAAASPLIDRNLGWSVIAADDADEVMRPVRQMIAEVAISCLLVTAVLALAAVIAARRMARPIIELVERFDAALTNMPHGLAMVDARGKLILCNATFRRMYLLPDALAATGTPLAAIAAHRGAAGVGPSATAEAQDCSDPGHDGCQELADGRQIDVRHNAIPSGGYVVTHQDVTEAVRAEQQIRHLATHDILTGLPNRARLRDRMVTALRHLRPGERLAVLCLDLDHFKTVNDTLGHPVGDLLLRSLTARLGDCLGDGDVLARLGGDEFVVLQMGILAPANAGELARRLIDATALPFELDGHQVVVGMSVGIAVTPEDGADADTLIRNADMALYRAKATGRGAARFFEPGMDAKLQERRRLELDLRQALATGQFTLEYQPLFDARTEMVTSVEALLRWRHPERGPVSPAEFIPIAEDMGLIVPLGEWVLRRACTEGARWPSTVRIAVNLSSLQFKSANLIGTVTSALADSGLPATRLELEITESVLLGDSDATLATLHTLRRLGVRIAMDDFGTGYSSLSYLRSFPFDKIKIDRSFVRDLATSADSVAIIKAISDLGTTLGMVTTAEGIETAEQFSLVRSHGCAEVQGFLFSRPRPAADITRMLAHEAEGARLSA